jgi:hypothetical protein
MYVARNWKVNGLPYNLKEISNNPKKFKVNLKDFISSNSFYTLEEFLKYDCIIPVKIE